MEDSQRNRNGLAQQNRRQQTDRLFSLVYSSWLRLPLGSEPKRIFVPVPRLKVCQRWRSDCWSGDASFGQVRSEAGRQTYLAQFAAVYAHVMPLGGSVCKSFPLGSTTAR